MPGSVSGPFSFNIFLNGLETVGFKYADDCAMDVPVLMYNDPAAGLVNRFLE